MSKYLTQKIGAKSQNKSAFFRYPICIMKCQIETSVALNFRFWVALRMMSYLLIVTLFTMTFFIHSKTHAQKN